MSSCAQTPHCYGGALCGQRREGRQDVRELPGCTPYRGHVMHALGRHLQPNFPDSQEKRCAGQVLIPPGSLRCTRLSHSETVCDTAWAGLHRSHPPHTHAAPVCVGAREVLGHQTPGGMKLAARQGKAPVWGCARHACCSAVGRPKCLDARRDHTGPGHWVRKETSYATKRRDDT
jgi:hypothetical protein